MSLRLMTREYIINFAKQVQEMYECRVIINEEKEPYCLFCASDIGKILKITNIRERESISHYNNEEKTLIKINTKGGKQSVIFITYEGLKRLLSKSRKPLVIDFCNKLKLDIYTKIYTCIESDTLKCIMEAFNGGV